MFDLNSIIKKPPFSFTKQEKKLYFEGILFELTKYHFTNCIQYKNILDLLGFDPNIRHSLEDLPTIPVRLFKDYELLSVNKSEIIKTMTSSGTTSQNVSKIFLDKETATNQTRVLTKIVSEFLGVKRMPMAIVDTNSVLKEKNKYSARGAAILGFSIFGKEIIYLLDENMKLNANAFKNFCKKYENEQILVFGLTSIIWEKFCEYLISTGKNYKINNSIILHGGGWKKLVDKQIDNNSFKNKLGKLCGIKKVHNYYGMVEQTGSIFMECDHGFLHCSNFSEVIMRRNDFSVCDFNEVGLIQLISVLPLSYPGHNILSDDMGEIIGVDNCPCGKLGKYFVVHGRASNADLRGCSDTIN